MFSSLKSVACVVCVLWLLACSGSSDGHDPIRSVVLEAGNGARAEFRTNTEEGDVTGTFQKVSEPTGEVVDDMADVSGEYLLDIQGNVSGDLVLTIPIRRDLLAPDWSPATLLPEVQNPGTGVWDSTEGLSWYDADQGALLFDAGVAPSAVEAVASGLHNTVSGALTAQTHKGRYRVRHVYFTKGVQATSPDSAFIVKYYPPGLHGKHSVPDDATWNSKSGNAVDPDVPDFVEDLHAALNSAYNAMLAIEGPSGKLFQPLTINQRQVWVYRINSAGESPIGGPMKLSSDRIKDYQDMKGVVGHELTHVFQGQYYIGGIASNVVNWVFRWNKWFIEATANYYGVMTAGLAGALKAEQYGVDESPNYLSVGLTASDRFAYYAAAHFLEWVALKYGNDVISDALSDDSKSIALVVLDRAIRKADGEAGLGSAFEQYAQDLVRRPGDMDKMNASVASLLFSYMTSQGLLPAANRLDNVTTYVRVKRSLAKLGAAYVELRVSTNEAALLVIDSIPAASSFLETFTWDVIGNTNQAFEGKNPLEDHSGKPMVVKNCGKGQACNGFTQIIVNTSFTNWEKFDFAYYVLVPPFVFSPEAGRVEFSTAEIGNIPDEMIREFRVFRRTEVGSFEKLGSVSWDGEPKESFKDGRIKADDVIVVQVVDRHGNVWPEVEVGESEGVWIGCRTVGSEAEYHWGCIQYPGDPSSTDFDAGATMQCINSGYKQYYAVFFDKESACRDWCSQAAASDSGTGASACDTPGKDPGTGTTPDACIGAGDYVDVCLNNACYSCCATCEGGLLWLYDCPDGCYTHSGESGFQTWTNCECN
ncbi:MAG: hypothetical protein GXP54_07880 [Deltaproteobacteria bacterium]|nr:hypothetical protein [Deltaproteobacteria bacterium]